MHVRNEHSKDIIYICPGCDEIFKTKLDIKEHLKNKHSRSMMYECSQCNDKFKTENILANHVTNKHTMQKCNHCPKEYSNKFELRRHNWRSHEQINCNFCGLTLENRHDLKRHKEDEHRVTQVPDCKFYMDGKCVDNDECLYKHEKSQKQTSSEKSLEIQTNSNEIIFCKKGLKCPRDECNIGNIGHRKISDVPCKYKQNCKKVSCPFRHSIEKSDFQLIRRINPKN